MGVSGVGKTHIGKLVAAELGLPFYDADDFHPPENVNKMARGVALNDEDRWPWLDILADNLSLWSKEKGAVLACSALRNVYRERMSKKAPDITFLMLKAEKAQIHDRMKKRSQHYMPASLLDSQINTLEELDADHIVWNIGTPESVAGNVVDLLEKGID